MTSKIPFFGKKHGHGGPHGPPVPPPTNPPPPSGGGGGTASGISMSSVGKYVAGAHPYTDIVPNVALPTTYLHTQYGYDTDGVSIGGFVDFSPINTGNRATNTALVQNIIDTNRVLNQNTRILLPNVFPMYPFFAREITFAGKWIYIQRATEPCAEGTRANPTNMANAPECMVAAGEEPAIEFNRKASRYYIMGIRFVMNPVLNHTYWMVPIFPKESSNDYRFTVADVNDQVILDRCLVQGGDAGTGPYTGKTRVGIFLDAKRSSVLNCYVHMFASIGEETKGILITQNLIATKIVNNFIEAGSIVGLIGGEQPKWGTSVGRPRNIEWRRNFHTRRLSYGKDDPSWDGVSGRTIKNLFETKNVDGLLFEGNVLHSNWADGQSGMALIIKSGTGDGGAGAGCGSENVTIRYNKIHGSIRCFAFNGLSDEIDAIPTKKVAVYDNLAYDIGTYAGQTSGLAWMFTQAVDDLYVRHNTLVHNEIVAGSLQMNYQQNPRTQRFVFTDNVTTIGSPDLGLFADGGLIGSAALNSWAENPTWLRNIFIGPFDPFIESVGMQGTTFVSNAAAMNFLNPGAKDYRLTASSPGYQAGVGGRNLGADLDKVDLATIGVAS